MGTVKTYVYGLKETRSILIVWFQMTAQPIHKNPCFNDIYGHLTH